MVSTKTTPNVTSLQLPQVLITPTILHVKHTEADGNLILFSPAWEDTKWNGNRAQPLCLCTVYMCGISSNVPVPFLLAGQQERATALQGLFCSYTPQFNMEKWLCLNFLYCRRMIMTIRVKVCGALWMDDGLRSSVHTGYSVQKTQDLRGILSIPALWCWPLCHASVARQSLTHGFQQSLICKCSGV